MIAFTVGGWPIYRYGIMYLLSFVLGYFYLQRVSQRKRMSTYPNLQIALTQGLDDILMAIVIGVILGGRFGDVLIYNRSHYAQHPDQILAVWNGGMSFVGGFIGVAIVIFVLKVIKKLNLQELFLLFDIIVFFLPLGILCGRIGNGLNQELYGKQATSYELRATSSHLLEKLNLIRVYNKVDTLMRWNTNLLEGFFEGVFLFIVNLIVFGKRLLTGIIKPGFITGLFCIIYGIIRFFLETLRDNPASEYWNGFLKSQLLMIGMIILGLLLVVLSQKWKVKFDK